MTPSTTTFRCTAIATAEVAGVRRLLRTGEERESLTASEIADVLGTRKLWVHYNTNIRIREGET